MTTNAVWNSEGQLLGTIIQKDREHCKTPRWGCWFNGSQPLRWRWTFGGRNNTRDNPGQEKEGSMVPL